MTTDITEQPQSHDLLIANGNETANLLRHLANNEIDSDYFAVVSECESYGQETDAELSITEFALRAAGYVDALVESLEKAQETVAFQQGEIKALLSSLESRTVKLPDALLPATHKSGELFMTPDNVEQGGYLNRDDVLRVLRAAGIKVEAE